MTKLRPSSPRTNSRSRTARRFAALCTVAAFVAAACSSDDIALTGPETTDAPRDETPADDTTPDDTTAAAPDVDLSVVALSALSGDPFDRVMVTGLGGLPTDDIALWMRSPDPENIPDDLFVPVYLLDDSASEAELVIPFHPADPMGGGEVELYIGSGETAEPGPTIPFTIGPLSPSDGAWNEFLDEFAARIDASATELGSSAESLAATDIDDVPAELLPLKISLTLLDDGTDDSLIALYDSPELTDDDRMLLDALTAQMQLTEVFEANVEFAETLQAEFAESIEAEREALDETEAELSGFRRPSSPGRRVERAPASPPVAATAPTVPAQSSSCRSANITVSDAFDLERKLKKALSLTISEGGPVDTVLRDIGTAATVAAFIPGVGWVAAAGGVGFSAIRTYHNGIAGLYPSRITSLTSEITTDVFVEDFVVPGYWGGTSVVAESTGWRADSDVFGTLMSAGGIVASGVLGQGLNVVEAFFLDLDLLAGETMAGMFIDSRSSGVLEFCPQQWSVDLIGPGWTTGTVRLGRFETDDSVTSYRPIDLGLNPPFDDLLRVEANVERFPNQWVWAEFRVEVGNAINLSGPSEIFVDNPMEEVEVEIFVQNAHSSEVEWIDSEGVWKFEDRPGTGEIPSRINTHIAAINEDDFPYVTSVRSASRTGLRVSGEPPRVHTIVVRLRELIVRPDPGGVLTGGQLQFTATDRNGNPVDVVWSATGGTIDANGLYTAGDRVGTFTVTAVAADNPDQRTTVEVQVDDGACVVGTWRLRTQPFLDQFMQGVPMGANAIEIGGQYIVEFREGGDYEGRRENWSWGVEIPDVGVAINTIDSVETGSWSILPGVDGGSTRLRINESSSSATVSVVVEAAGMTMALPGGEQQFDTAGVSGDGPFTCSGNLLTLTSTGQGFNITVELDRVG